MGFKLEEQKEDVAFGKLKSRVELKRVGKVQVNIQTHCMHMGNAHIIFKLHFKKLRLITRLGAMGKEAEEEDK